jgi:hypothetical protein
LKAVIPTEDDGVEEKKRDQHDGIVEQYKKIIREQVSLHGFFSLVFITEFDMLLCTIIVFMFKWVWQTLSFHATPGYRRE